MHVPLRRPARSRQCLAGFGNFVQGLTRSAGALRWSCVGSQDTDQVVSVVKANGNRKQAKESSGGCLVGSHAFLGMDKPIGRSSRPREAPFRGLLRIMTLGVRRECRSKRFVLAA